MKLKAGVMDYHEFQLDLIEAISKDDYLLWHDSIRVISVFDDVKYDRSDIDLLVPAMRKYVSQFLNNLGYKAKSGKCIVHRDSDIKCWLPKPSVLAASPFDITRYQARDLNDIYILTPTQTAAYYFQQLDFDLAIMAIGKMIKTQPVNILKLLDTLNSPQERRYYGPVLRYLLDCQQQVVSKPGVKFKRSLGAVFG
ncbi:MAG: hypothetical protein ACJAYG_001045 [Oceanicoccus sp.]|jgi:hypothetical protein